MSDTQVSTIFGTEDMTAFADVLAAELGFTVEEVQASSFMPGAYLVGEVEGTSVRLLVTKSNTSLATDAKVTITGLLDVPAGRINLAYGLGEHKATLSLSRGVATIAKELHRRVFPGQIADARVLTERIVRAIADEEALRTRADAIEAAFAPMQIIRRDVGASLPSMIAHAENVRANVQVAYGCMEISGLNTDQMLAVAAVLAQVSTD